MRAAAISASATRSIRSSHLHRPAGPRPSGKSSGSSMRNPTRPIGHAHRLNQPGAIVPPPIETETSRGVAQKSQPIAFRVSRLTIRIPIAETPSISAA
jgi:hypothetical protein